MNREIKIDLLEQLKQGLITLEDFKAELAREQRGNMPIICICYGENESGVLEYDYNGKLETEEIISKLESSVIFVKAAGSPERVKQAYSEMRQQRFPQ